MCTSIAGDINVMSNDACYNGTCLHALSHSKEIDEQASNFVFLFKIHIKKKNLVKIAGFLQLTVTNLTTTPRTYFHGNN